MLAAPSQTCMCAEDLCRQSIRYESLPKVAPSTSKSAQRMHIKGPLALELGADDGSPGMVLHVLKAVPLGGVFHKDVLQQVHRLWGHQ